MSFVEEFFGSPLLVTLGVLALASYMMMKHYEKKCDPIRDKLKAAIETQDKPSELYKFLNEITKEESEKYFNLSMHVLKFDSPPTNIAVN